jgi:phage terminase large subunit-like protein
MPRRDLGRAMFAAEALVRDGGRALLRQACSTDLWFLLAYACGRQDMRRQWLLDRCDEISASPNGFLDLWAREHYKSTIITFGLTLQDILKNRELGVAIFSHTRPAAKSHLRPIKRELEENEVLKELFPDVLYQEPQRESPQWSENDGIVVRRTGRQKEATLEAWGLVDGQPIGKHFGLRVYDDLVTLDNVGSVDMRDKVVRAWELSISLGRVAGVERYVGTRYHYADAYQELERRGVVRVRKYPAEVDGRPVLMSAEDLAERRTAMGPYVYASQMMLDPKGGDSVGFRDEWWKTWLGVIMAGNRYLIVDPANSKRKGSDFTAMLVVEASPDGNLYLRDAIRDRLNLLERIEAAIGLHKLWRPLMTGWEQYGLQADIEALEAEQRRVGYRFPVTPLAGPLSKEDRILGLVPRFARGGIWFPERLVKPCRYSGRDEDLVRVFREEEYLGWPYVAHDDFLDTLARVEDPTLNVAWPKMPGSHGSQRQTFASMQSSAVERF